MEVKLNIFLVTFRNQDANQVKYTALTALDVLMSLLVLTRWLVHTTRECMASVELAKT